MSSALIGIDFTLNGVRQRAQVRSDARLLDVLRDQLGLTGTKEGCGSGECGACTVILDDRLVNACLMPAFQADGTTVTTIEGLGTPEAPSDLQAAFVAEDSVQCGFCTPGMVVAATAILEETGGASRDTYRKRLSGNICRCTGYSQILNAMDKVAEGWKTPSPPPDAVGQSVPRVDAMDKVTGRCRYTADIPVPEGCLHGVTVRATIPHGQLKAIDTAEALAIPGVVAVLTWKDVPGELHYGNAVPDQPVLVRDHIRFYGEAIAVVLGESLVAAQLGAKKVRVLTESLPPVSDPAEALQENAPRVHDAGNLLDHQTLRKGDVARAMGEAEQIVEHHYTTGRQETLCLEPEVALAEPDGEGGVIVKAPSQNVFFDRHHISRTLGLHKKKVQVVQQPTGAAFGSREDVYAQIHAALGVVVTGRPIRIVWTREESQLATTKRHPAELHYRAGVDRDGTLKALEISVLADTGAYASWAPNIARKMLVHGAGPYDVKNIAIDIKMVYTNNGISGAFRGFGATQVAFASESFMDEVAGAIGMDPVAFRRKNHLAVGKVTATGQTITGSCGLEECLDRALTVAEERAAQRPAPAPGFARGRGVSTIYYGIGYGNAIPDIGSAVAELLPEGRFRIRCGAIDYGQGALTVFTQIACEVLKVSRAQLEVWTGDSNNTPDSGSTVASRQTYMSGEAVRQAAERLRTGLLTFSAKRWGRPIDALRLSDSGLLDGSGACLASLAELHAAATEAGVRVRNQARFRAKTTKLDLETGQGDAYWPYAFAVHVADVEVHLKTGQLRVVDLVAAHDVGKAINPKMVVGQIVGGAAQGLGFALMEDHLIQEGIPLTRNMDTYRIPGAGDIPEIIPLLIEDPEPSGPFGAKGVGEPVLVAVGPAIANAVADATGVRIRRLPLLPERIRAGLLEQSTDGHHPQQEGGAQL